jgi:hypothetical protein
MENKKRVETVSVDLGSGSAAYGGCEEGGFDDTSPPMDSFTLPYSYKSPYNEFISSWRATNDDSGFVADVAVMSRSYSRLADWGDGWIVMSGASWDGPKGKELNKRKQHDGMLPAGPAHLWLADTRALADRLERKLDQLVDKYNKQSGVKQAQTYREPICRSQWRNAKGKLEETVFELQFSSYGFHQTNVTKRIDERYKEGGDVFDDIYRDAVITPRDVRAIIKLKTTVSLSNQTQQATPNTRTSARRDNFNQDRRGYNVPALHFLYGLRDPHCQAWINEVASAIRVSRERRGLPTPGPFPGPLVEKTHVYVKMSAAEVAHAEASAAAAGAGVPSTAKVAKIEPMPPAQEAAAAAKGVRKGKKKEEEEEEEEVDLEMTSEDDEEEVDEEEEEEEDEEDEEDEDDSQDIDAPEHQQQQQQSTQALIGDADKKKKEGE